MYSSIYLDDGSLKRCVLFRPRICSSQLFTEYKHELALYNKALSVNLSTPSQVACWAIQRGESCHFKDPGVGFILADISIPSPISQGIARTHSQPSQVAGWANECGKSCHSKVVRWMEHRSYPCRQQTPFHSSLTRRSNTTSDSATSSDQCSHTLSGFLTCRRAFRIHKSGPGGF